MFRAVKITSQSILWFLLADIYVSNGTHILRVSGEEGHKRAEPVVVSALFFCAHTSIGARDLVLVCPAKRVKAHVFFPHL